MQVQVSADMAVFQTRPKQQRGGMNRATRDHDLSAFHDDPITFLASRFDANCEGPVDAHSFGPRLYQDPRAVPLRVQQPSFGCGLFCADGTPVAAVSANVPLVAADYVARH